MEHVVIANNVDIKAIAGFVVKACSKDPSRKNLQNVLFQVNEEGEYTATATDGLIMQVLGKAVDNGGNSSGYIVSAKAFKDVFKLGYRSCDIHFNEDGIIDFVVDSEVVLQSATIQDIYPNYRRCIPKYFSKKITFNVGEVLDAIKSIKGKLTSELKKISFFPEGDILKISNVPSIIDDEDCNEVVESVGCTFFSDSYDRNEGKRISFSLDYIKKAISRFSRKQNVWIQYNTDISASLWGVSGENVTTLVMPVRTSY